MKVRELIKTIVLEDTHNLNIDQYLVEVKKIIEVKSPITEGYNVSFKRETGDFIKKELVIHRSHDKSMWTYMENTANTDKVILKLRNSKLDEREEALKNRYLNITKIGLVSNNVINVSEWKEHVVRVGTGFRVRKDDKNPKRRRFDVGYADVKEYNRKDNRDVIVDSSSMNITIVGKCENARVKVMNAVSDIEKRRPVSKYTGSGIIRKSKQGKRKLKSTKSSSK